MKKAPLKKTKLRRLTGFAILGSSILGVSALTLRAVTWNWDSTTNLWSSAGDWVAPGPAGPPVSAQDTGLVFAGSGSTAYTSTGDLDTPFILNQLTLNSTATVTETITGNPLDLVANGATNPTITNNGSGSFAVSTDIMLDGATTLGGTGNGIITLNGLLSGANGLNVTSGRYVLTNIQNTFTGLTVSGGILEINAGAGPIDIPGTGANSYFGSGPITINGGELRLSTTGNSAGNVIFNSAPQHPINFGTAGGILNMNGMDNTAGLNINLANAPAATAIIKFAGGVQGFDGSFGSTAAPWADDTNALRITTLTGATSTLCHSNRHHEWSELSL